MRKPGSIEPVIYFRNHRDPTHAPGYVMLAPYSSFPTPDGYERDGADTLALVDKLQARLQDQARVEWIVELDRDERRLEGRRAAIRDSIYAQIASSETSEFNKDFLREYLKLRIEKRDRHRQRFLERELFLSARENDLHGRDPASEEWSGTADLTKVTTDG